MIRESIHVHEHDVSKWLQGQSTNSKGRATRAFTMGT